VHADWLNQPVEVPELRSELRALLDTGVPQVLVRLGYARYPAQWIRRLRVRRPADRTVRTVRVTASVRGRRP
jgi:hypothetical protein